MRVAAERRSERLPYSGAAASSMPAARRAAGEPLPPLQRGAHGQQAHLRAITRERRGAPRRPPRRPRPIHTVPTGLPGSAPPGPAMPVTDTATSASSSRRAPWAMARAVSALTAPCRSSVSRGTPRTLVLHVVHVAHHAAAHRLRAARHAGEHGGYQAAREALGRADPHPGPPCGSEHPARQGSSASGSMEAASASVIGRDSLPRPHGRDLRELARRPSRRSRSRPQARPWAAPEPDEKARLRDVVEHRHHRQHERDDHDGPAGHPQPVAKAAQAARPCASPSR